MASGASPTGVEPGNEAEVARHIRRMFERVAPRYDLLNRLLSLRIDQYWRRAVVLRVRPYLERPDARVMDLCCGTGDLLMALEAERRRLGNSDGCLAVGADFCYPMLATAKVKLGRRKMRALLLEGDALQFPMRGAAADLITIAYGFRNLANYRKGIEEMYRLLAPGGCLAILEFSRPRNRLLGPLFEFYFRRVLPCIGNAISGSGDAYSYLQKSVERFLEPEELAAEMKACGFQRVEVVPLTAGISFLHLAYK